MKFKSFIASVVLGFTMIFANAEPMANVDYNEVNPPIPQLHNDKIEILEFFSYTCSHCKDLEPALNKYVANIPSDTYFRGLHVVWDKNMLPFARIAAAVNASGTASKANYAIFNNLFHGDPNQRARLDYPSVFAEWAEKQGDWGKSLLKAYNTDDAMKDAQAMAKMTLDYNIDSTPQIIVGGKYRLIRTANNEEDMKKLNELVKKVRAERNMTAPAKKTQANNMGASIAKQANHK